VEDADVSEDDRIRRAENRAADEDEDRSMVVIICGLGILFDSIRFDSSSRFELY